jgi:hypothetical protein
MKILSYENAIPAYFIYDDVYYLFSANSSDGFLTLGDCDTILRIMEKVLETYESYI